MRKLIVQEWLSLDGFAADKDGKLDFFPTRETDQFSDRDQLRFLDGVDTVLLGRKTYELFVGFWPTAKLDQEIVADRLNTLPKVVFSNTLSEAPWGNWCPARVVSSDALAEIRRLKAEDGKHLVLWGSLTLAQQLIFANLVDEYHLQICPTMIGGGRPLFPSRPAYARLKRVEVRNYDTGVTCLRYERDPSD